MGSASTSAGGGIGHLLAVGLCLVALPQTVSAQFFDPSTILRPPANVPNTAPPPAQSVAPAPSTSPAPKGPALQSLPPASAAPSAASGQGLLAASARFGRDLPAISSGLHWRIYSAKSGP